MTQPNRETDALCHHLQHQEPATSRFENLELPWPNYSPKMKIAPRWLGASSKTGRICTARGRKNARASEFILARGVLLPSPNMQLPQLLLVHLVGRPGHQALRALGLGEGDDVADGFGAGHQRDQAIQAEGQAAVRRRAVLQGFQ